MTQRNLSGLRAFAALAWLLAACGGSSTADPAAPEAAQPSGAPHHSAGHQGHKSGHMHRRFEKAEDWARLFDDPSRAAWQKPDEVVALVALSPGMTVVDVGAGTGYFLSRLSRAVGERGQVIATDIEPDMVRYMTERAAREKLANVRAQAAPVDDVGVPAGSADRILFVDVWHHIGDRERYAARLHAALKPGGAVVIVDFDLESKRGPEGHKLDPEVVLREMRAGGLTAELATETLPDQYVVIARRP
jgi:cyclopropane fatty-acyl-phospholipid synthase-like methyltransferase